MRSSGRDAADRARPLAGFRRLAPWCEGVCVLVADCVNFDRLGGEKQAGGEGRASAHLNHRWGRGGIPTALGRSGPRVAPFGGGGGVRAGSHGDGFISTGTTGLRFLS